MKEIKKYDDMEERTQKIIKNEMKRPNLIMLILITAVFALVSKNLNEIIRPVGKAPLYILIFFEILIFAFMIGTILKTVIFLLSFKKDKK